MCAAPGVAADALLWFVVPVSPPASSMFLIDDPTIDTRYVLRGQEDWSLLQINCTVLEGNSGGPVINASGDVVGIVAMGKSSSHGVGSISYAVSMDQAWPIIQSLVKQGWVMSLSCSCWCGALCVTTTCVVPAACSYAVRGRVGMSISFLEAPLADSMLPPGVETAIAVTSVAAASPAQQCGFQEGDVITSINGHAVTSKGVYFQELGPLYEDGKRLHCTVMRPSSTRVRTRQGQWTQLELDLVPRPDRV